MSNLTILNTAVRQLDNLYSLNDLHAISGNDPKHRPSLFIRLETAKELIAEISKEVRSTDLIFKTLRGRNIQGTYACKELVIAYAAWISPAFHLIVLRAFLNQLEQKQPQQLALPEPPKPHQVRHLREVLPLAALYGKANQLAEDFQQLAEFLRSKGYGAMAEICKHYVNELNANTPLMHRASSCIQRLAWDLPEEDQQFLRHFYLN